MKPVFFFPFSPFFFFNFHLQALVPLHFLTSLTVCLSLRWGLPLCGKNPHANPGFSLPSCFFLREALGCSASLMPPPPASPSNVVDTRRFGDCQGGQADATAQTFSLYQTAWERLASQRRARR